MKNHVQMLYLSILLLMPFGAYGFMVLLHHEYYGTAMSLVIFFIVIILLFLKGHPVEK